jgi:lambda family phage tail tape measure protein
MATTIRIIFQSVGAQQVTQQVQGIGTAAAAASKPLGLLKSLLASYVSFSAIKQLAEMSDELTIFKNRLQQTLSPQEELNGLMRQAFDVALATRQPLDVVGDTYNRLRESMDDMDVSSAEVLSVSRELLQMFTATGRTSSEAASAVSQLAQAFGQGTLTGRQFRSLLGNSTSLVRELAKALNLSTAELRQMGAQGRFSAEFLFSGLLQAAPEVNKSFQTMEPTFKSEVAKLKVTAQEILPESVQSFPRRFVQGLREQLGVLSGQEADYRRTEAFRTRQQQVEDELRAETMRGRMRTMVEDLSTNQVDYVSTTQRQLKAQKELADASIFSGETETEKLREVLHLKQAWIMSQSQINGMLERAAEAARFAFTGEETESQKAVLMFKAKAEVFEKLNKAGFRKMDDQQYSDHLNMAQTIADLKQRAGLMQIIGGSQEQLNEKLRIANGLMEGTNDRKSRLQEFALRAQAAFLGAFPDTGAATSRGNLLIELAQQDNRRIGDEMLRVWRESAGPARDYEQALIAINEALRTNAIDQDQSNLQLLKAHIALLNSKRDLSSGFQLGILKIQDEITNFAALSEQTVTDAFHGMEDALVGFVQNGKLSFSSLVNSVLADLTRLAARQSISGLFGLFTGGGGLGFNGDILGETALPGRASGGPVYAGQGYVVGERGPESFVPNTSGYVMPSGGGANITILNLTDPQEVYARLNDPNVQDRVVNIISRNRVAVKAALGLH